MFKILKILITTGDFKNFLVPNFYNLITELAKITELKVWHESGDINEIIEFLDFIPDFILINEFEEINSPHITGLENLTIPYAVLLYDLHYEIEKRSQKLQEYNVRYIFSLYRDKFRQWYPEFEYKMIWLPHHVNTNIFKDYGIKKTINYLLMGDIQEKIYPLRKKILDTMKFKPGFIYHEHPGWRHYSDNEKGYFFIGENYAKEINRAKIFFSCDSIYKYPLLKYFEVLACNTLLLAPASAELNDLGFVDQETFIAIDETNFEEKADYYLHHDKEREMIARQGLEMIQARHSTTKRAHDLKLIVEQILNQNER